VTFGDGRGLTKDVDVDLHVMDVEVIDVLQIHVVLGTILPFYARDLDILDLIELKQVGSAIFVLVIPFTDPPIVAEAINFTFSLDSKITATLNSQETIGLRLWKILKMSG
jgi:hypothetical protein